MTCQRVTSLCSSLLISSKALPVFLCSPQIAAIAEEKTLIKLIQKAMHGQYRFPESYSTSIIWRWIFLEISRGYIQKTWLFSILIEESWGHKFWLPVLIPGVNAAFRRQPMIHWQHLKAWAWSPKCFFIGCGSWASHIRMWLNVLRKPDSAGKWINILIFLFLRFQSTELIFLSWIWLLLYCCPYKPLLLLLYK